MGEKCEYILRIVGAHRADQSSWRYMHGDACNVNIHSTPVLPQRMKVVAAYRRCMYASLYGYPLRGSQKIPAVAGARPV